MPQKSLFHYSWVNKLHLLSAPYYSGVCYHCLCVNASRCSILSVQNVNSYALTFKSVSRSCLRIHLVCQVGPQDCFKRCRGGHQGELIHTLGILLALTICLSGEPAASIVNSCGRSGPQILDCILIQSNGVIAQFEIEGCCIRKFF
jgi:hypothetical protein